MISNNNSFNIIIYIYLRETNVKQVEIVLVCKFICWLQNREQLINAWSIYQKLEYHIFMLQYKF